jgi:hypothetical protein
MTNNDPHLTDEQLLLELDGELANCSEKGVRAHLAACWRCRSRLHELETAITDFVKVHQSDANVEVPPIAGPRALLKARLEQLSAESCTSRVPWIMAPRKFIGVSVACAVLALTLFVVKSPLVSRSATRRTGSMIVSIPDSTLTPGATLLVSQSSVCNASNTKNKGVSVALQRKVFDEYGISGADPQAFEVDYLVTPALGGADDIHNLWPHSYRKTVWNAQVKDDLEDRLRDMVCDGSLDLATAQHDIAENWIAAYKKYFHTEMPLERHEKSTDR